MSEYGDVVIKGHDWWPDVGYREIEILEAAPRTLIGPEMLEEIQQGTLQDSHAWLDGDVLTIRARNRTVVYRILGQSPDPTHHGAWIAEWPD